MKGISWFLLLSLVCFNAQAWSPQGHEFLSRQIYQHLSPKEKRFYDQILATSPYGQGAEGMAGLSAWPDTVRKQKVADVFHSWGVSPPAALESFLSADSSTWHYQNHYIYARTGRACELRDRGELREALLTLDDSLKRARDSKQMAILLGFYLHLLEDLHQPLHTFAVVDASCHSDRGGNDVCLKKDGRGQCEYNLHQMWDQGFGLWSEQIPVHLMASKIEKPLYLRDEIDAWLKEGPALKSKIYPASQSGYFDPLYLARSRQLVRERAELAISRGTRLLETLYRIQTGRE